MRSYIVSLFLVLCVAATGVSDPGATQPLRGIVYAADGSPAAGAVVWGARLDYGPLERRETTADDKGAYALDLSPGNWMVWARRDLQGGEGPARHKTVVVAAGKAPEPIAIHLEERGLFHGRLLEEETGQPIARGKLFLDDLFEERFRLRPTY